MSTVKKVKMNNKRKIIILSIFLTCFGIISYINIIHNTIFMYKECYENMSEGSLFRVNYSIIKITEHFSNHQIHFLLILIINVIIILVISYIEKESKLLKIYVISLLSFLLLTFLFYLFPLANVTVDGG